MAKIGSTVFGAAVAMIVSGGDSAKADHYRSRCGVSGSYGYRTSVRAPAYSYGPVYATAPVGVAYSTYSDYYYPARTSRVVYRRTYPVYYRTRYHRHGDHRLRFGFSRHGS